jgi:hypothetical protein
MRCIGLRSHLRDHGVEPQRHLALGILALGILSDHALPPLQKREGTDRRAPLRSALSMVLLLAGYDLALHR